MTRALAVVLVLVALAAATVSLSQSTRNSGGAATPKPTPIVAVDTMLKTRIPVGGGMGPVQPIAFSHKTHAGLLQMNCLYCHYSADKSPIANIPAMSVCMGCHKLAVTERPEIQKLTAYWERGETPPWAEVYRLPPHVKFNHKRHVKAGVQCAECHGKVETMDVVYQYPSLKMGWCITCHRQKVNDPKFPATLDCVACHH